VVSVEKKLFKPKRHRLNHSTRSTIDPEVLLYISYTVPEALSGQICKSVFCRSRRRDQGWQNLMFQ